jgi:hypothetical protein
MVKRGGQLVVHIALDELPKRAGQSIDDVLSQNVRLEACLEKFQKGWERPSADEAVWITTAKESDGVQSTMRWVEELRNEIHSSTEWSASAGVASTRLAARVASRMAKPRGLLLILPGYESRFLASVSLEELDELRPAQAAALRRRGIGTFGGLADLPFEEARHLLGPDAAKLLGLIRGEESAPQRRRGGKVGRALGILCRRASKKLEEGRWRARGLELGLVYRDGIALERYTIVPHPVQNTRDLESSANHILRWFPTRNVPIVGLSLTATGLSPQPGELPFSTRPKDVRVQIGRVS